MGNFLFFQILYALCCVQVTNAVGTVSPSNATLVAQAGDLVMTYGLQTLAGTTTNSTIVYPLTTSMGLGATLANLRGSYVQSSWLQFANAFNAGNINSQEIAYVSCDANTNDSNIDASGVVAQIVSGINKPRAVLLYSLTQPWCSIEGDFNYTAFFSMTSVSDATTVSSFLNAHVASPTPTASIAISSSSNGSGITNTGTTSGPTTAVAMSILYSITGVITILFLVIIATGAIRAHRHPERYGPRGGGLPGRPRQSRAKGLARAMLETLPIVKFGDDQPAKPGTVDTIELAEGPETTDHSKASVEGEEQHQVKEKHAAGQTVVPVQEAGMGAATTASVHSKEQESDEALGCSICTEDFEKGEDVRVLPCNHKYHPACVDPWLLNVSGTCPLCRIDLRPVTANTETEASDYLAPPLEEQAAASEGANISVLRAVPHSQRLAALRALRDERRQQQRDVLAQRGIADPDAEVTEEADAGRRHRLAMRLKDKFGIRTSNRRESIIVAGPSSIPTTTERSQSIGGPSAPGIIFGGSTGQDSLAMRMR